MTNERVDLTLPESFARALNEEFSATGKSKSEIVQEALVVYWPDKDLGEIQRTEADDRRTQTTQPLDKPLTDEQLRNAGLL